MSLLIALLVATAAPSTAALQILKRHECARCHEVEGIRPPREELNCAGCHVNISSSAGDPVKTRKGEATYGEAWARFVKRSGEHYVHLPSLTRMSRFQASWLRRFLRSPEDLRPNLSESMIRHAMTEQEIDTLVKGWAAVDVPRPSTVPSAERLAAGEKAFDQKGCAVCHLFGNVTFPSVGGLARAFTPETSLRALAPDLRHARDRLSRDLLEQWIRDPRSVKPNTPMPLQAVTPEEASLLADFIYFASPGSPASPVVRQPPPLDANAPTPTWEEVNAKVFGVLCIHCHEDLHPEAGVMSDGGPGNTGGFGFKGAGLSFETYASLMKGSHGPGGKRVSVFRPGPTGEPVLIERLRLRFVENARDHVLPGADPIERPAISAEAPRGMPLGLPAITDEQFSLVERWVRGGHPGPRP